jgi:DNA-binding NarL/FixJ family response regulator
MADGASWFTRTVIEKLKALRQTKQTPACASDLEMLSDREREVLGLICEGRSGVQMSTMLGLSQNTVRNHIAGLYRKIGVNRRTAAIIWARERGITAEEALRMRRRARPRPNNPPGISTD